MFEFIELHMCIRFWFFFFFKQKTAYEMRISDWSSDVCSSDLPIGLAEEIPGYAWADHKTKEMPVKEYDDACDCARYVVAHLDLAGKGTRSEEHTSELQSLMRISYAVFCLKKKKHTNKQNEC